MKLRVFAEMTRAVNAGDASAYADLYAPDARITIHGSGPLVGRPAIRQYEVELLREFPGARLAFYDVWQKAGQAVVHYAVGGQTPNGASMGHEGLLFYRFEPSGLIAEERRYLDSLTPMAQMGLLGAGAPARSLPVLPAGPRVHVGHDRRGEGENVARVKAVLAALDSKDEAAFLSSFTEDAVLDDLTGGQPVAGETNVKAWFETWTHAVPEATTDITTTLGVGEFVLVETIVRGRLQAALGRLVASDKPFTVHRAVVAQLKNGKLVRMSVFMNGKELAEAVGQWPPRAGNQGVPRPRR